jgi:hypothetical protein
MGRRDGRGGGRGRGGPQCTGTDQYGEDHFDRDDAGPMHGGSRGRGGGDGGGTQVTCVPTSCQWRSASNCTIPSCRTGSALSVLVPRAQHCSCCCTRADLHRAGGPRAWSSRSSARCPSSCSHTRTCSTAARSARGHRWTTTRTVATRRTSATRCARPAGCALPPGDCSLLGLRWCACTLRLLRRLQRSGGRHVAARLK